MYRLNKVCLCVSIILGCTSIANADIVNTNGAGVQKRPNGPTVVNINKASDKGISHNVYSTFDVDRNGVILNNSAVDSNTTLGGHVAGNSNLSSGPANVILNEVTSNRASTINGMIEVAGNKAQVIVANPSGITCNSCGFINTERATLTTGKVVNAFNGEIAGYNVDRGAIVINNSLTSDSPTDIIARSVSIRGKIEAAKQLTVIAGSNFVDRDNQFTTAIKPYGSSARYGIDVSSLGGMYSDKITLITTENGVGVSNNGNISANAGGLSLITNGPVLNQSGNIESHGDILIDSVSTVTNYANITSAGGNITINSPKKLINKNGNISAKESVTVNSNYVYNDNGTIQTRDGNINIDTQTLYNTANSRNNIHTQVPKGILAGGDVNISSQVIKNTNTDLSAKKNVNIKTTSLDNYSSLVKSGANLNIETKTLNNDMVSSIDSGAVLTVNADRVINKGSILFKNGTANINAGNISNTYGYIQGGTLNSVSDVFDNNSGYVNTTNSMNINSRVIYNKNSASFKNVSTRFGLVNQVGGMESTDGSIKLSGEELYNNSGKIASAKIERLPTDGSINLYINKKIQNDKGSITSSNDINVNTALLSNNYGEINAGSNVNIKASTSVTNLAGKINANKTTTIESPLINSSRKGEITGETVVITTNKYIN